MVQRLYFAIIRSYYLELPTGPFNLPNLNENICHVFIMKFLVILNLSALAAAVPTLLVCFLEMIER